MRILGVITARGGSRRLPGKNIADLGGRPLIAWTIKTAIEACTSFVTSTDDMEIAKVARQWGSPIVHCPLDLERPDMHIEQVKHAVRAFLEGGENAPYDAVVLLQPTSPFRGVQDIAGAAEIMQRNAAMSVISVRRFPSVNTVFRIGHAGRMRDVVTDDPLHSLYTPNGAIYLVNTDHLMADGDWYGPSCYAYEMPPERSLDIDTHSDMAAAQASLDPAGNFSLATAKKVAAG